MSPISTTPFSPTLKANLSQILLVYTCISTVVEADEAIYYLKEFLNHLDSLRVSPYVKNLKIDNRCAHYNVAEYKSAGA